MKCSNCGSEIKGGAKFCRECGSPVVEKTEVLEGSTCPECGNLLEENALFCNNCGHRVSNEPEEVEISNRCPKCNSPLKDGALFCGECGKSLTRKSVKETKSSESPKKKKDRGLVFLIALLIIVLIGSVVIIGYIYYQNNSVDIVTPDINLETKIEEDEAKIETESEILFEEIEESDEKQSKDYICIFVKSTDNTLNLRSLSKHESELVGKVESENMLMYYYGESGQGYGSDGIMHDWYKVYLDNDLQGWVRSDLVKVKE